MARGKTLLKLLNDLRHEARLSQNPAHNAQVRDSQVATLQRTPFHCSTKGYAKP